MKYYGWAGWEKEHPQEDARQFFLVSPIRKIHTRDAITTGHVVVDLDKALFTNAPRAFSGADYGVEIDKDFIFDTMDDALQEVIKRIFY
jgi:hypothetical protein